MKVVILFSGGKDSTYAAWWAKKQGWEIVSLLTAVPQEGSMMFHHPNARVAAVAAQAMDLPHQFFEAKEGEKAELEVLEAALADFSGKADGVVSGALASSYQKTRIDRICEKLGLKSFAPLWQRDQEEALREMVSLGFKIIVVGCFAEGLGEEWLGREIDGKAIDSLVALNKKFKISIGGEGGEWESFVVDSPIHRKTVEIVSSGTEWERNSGFLRIDKTRLLPKN